MRWKVWSRKTARSAFQRVFAYLENEVTDARRSELHLITGCRRSFSSRRSHGFSGVTMGCQGAMGQRFCTNGTVLKDILLRLRVSKRTVPFDTRPVWHTKFRLADGSSICIPMRHILWLRLEEKLSPQVTDEGYAGTFPQISWPPLTREARREYHSSSGSFDSLALAQDDSVN